MNNTTQPTFIIIGSIKDYFDENIWPVRGTYLKFLVVKEKDKDFTQMLLMKEHQPYQYHAEGLLSYMREKNLSEIAINGGGKVEIYPEGKRCTFSGKSYAFGYACAEEITSLITNAWPSFECVCDLSGNNQEYISAGEKIYSIQKVKYEADNP